MCEYRDGNIILMLPNGVLQQLYIKAEPFGARGKAPPTEEHNAQTATLCVHVDVFIIHAYMPCRFDTRFSFFNRCCRSVILRESSKNQSFVLHSSVNVNTEVLQKAINQRFVKLHCSQDGLYLHRRCVFSKKDDCLCVTVMTPFTVWA